MKGEIPTLRSSGHKIRTTEYNNPLKGLTLSKKNNPLRKHTVGASSESQRNMGSLLDSIGRECSQPKPQESLNI